MKVLVVDDDRVIADVVAFTLRRAGFQIVQAHDGEAALRLWEGEEPDLIVLGVNLPKLNGFTVCKQIREQSDTPIILLTVRGEEDDIIQGLEIGADDYIPKPFSPRQLVARAHAVLRRAGKRRAPGVRNFGDMILNLDRRELHIGQSKVIQLTTLESRLLDYLMLNAGRVLTNDAIINHVWGVEGGDRDMLRHVIHRLRSKLEPDLSQPTYIQTVFGIGYGFALQSTPE